MLFIAIPENHFSCNPKFLWSLRMSQFLHAAESVLICAVLGGVGGLLYEVVHYLLASRANSPRGKDSAHPVISIVAGRN